MGILITVLCLGFVIFIHELGHLLAAKWSGIGVSEFSIGMGPCITGFTFGETVYNLRIFPIGGYVKLAGLDETDDQFDEAVFFQNRPLYKRTITILAGSLMNLLLGYVIFFGIVTFVGIPVTSSIIDNVVKDSPAFNAGLMPGDTLKKINNKPIGDVYNDFIRIINKSNDSVVITYERNGVDTTREITPYFDNDVSAYRLGIQLQSNNQRQLGLSSIVKAIELTAKSVSLLFLNIDYLIQGKATVNDLSGPIGIVQIASYQLAQSITNFFNIMAFISITLGIMNLLPIPVLDGGHLLFLLYEAIRGKPFPKKYMLAVSNVFAVCLIFLMLYVVVNDFRFWNDRNTMMEMMQPDD